MLDSCSDNGLVAIAKYNNYDAEWEAEKKLFTDAISLLQKHYIDFTPYAKYYHK